jgi:hypothetical protein
MSYEMIKTVEKTVKKILEKNFPAIGKKCNKCLEYKPFEAFGKEERGLYKLRSECKICRNKYQREKYKLLLQDEGRREKTRKRLKRNWKIYRAQNGEIINKKRRTARKLKNLKEKLNDLKRI